MRGVDEVAEYVITDGSRYIYKNHTMKYVPTLCESLADVFNKKQAENIYNNSLSKALKSVFYVQKIDRPPENVKQVSKEDLENNTEKIMLSDNIQRWIDKLSDLNGLFKEMTIRKNQLVKQLSEIDKKLSDNDHYIEFTSLNAAQGYNAYKQRKEMRISRRSIKNELEILEFVLSRKISESITDEVIKKANKMDNRTYEPRELDELFDL